FAPENSTIRRICLDQSPVRINATLFEPFRNPCGIALPKLKLPLRAALVQRRRGRSDVAARDGLQSSDPQPRRAVFLRQKLRSRDFASMKNFEGALVEAHGLGCGYQASPSGWPVKQRFAELQLKRLERAGYGGLRHMQALRRIHHAAAL